MGIQGLPECILEITTAVHTMWQDTTLAVNHNIIYGSFDVKNTRET